MSVKTILLLLEFVRIIRVRNRVPNPILSQRFGLTFATHVRNMGCFLKYVNWFDTENLPTPFSGR